jgi:hypothetical protein
MRTIGVLFGAEWRRRRAAWIALAVLVSIIGATVLIGASAATRTSSAFPQFLNRYGYDAEVFGLVPFPKKLTHLPGVERIAQSSYYFNGNVTADGRFVPADDVNVMSLPTTRLSSTVKLLSGSFPVGPKEILVGYSMQQQYGLHIGSTVIVPTFAPDQRRAVLVLNEYPPARGPRLRFRVVGVAASAVDFASTSPSYSIYTSDAFDRAHRLALLSGALALVRLKGGERDMPAFQFAANHMTKTLGEFFSEDVGSATSAIEESINPQAVGWWLFALFAALAGLILIGQALVRQSLTEKESYPTLAALGVRPTQLFGLGVCRALAIGFAGALGSVGLAYLFSPFIPVGIARATSVEQGFVFDGPALVLGLFAIVIVVLVLALWPSWRDSQVQADRGRGESPVTSHVSAATVVARTGAPPSALIGVRNALERGRGRTSVPVVTALVGTVLAVAALISTTIFGASLSNLLATPRLYGANWQVNLDNVTTKQLHVLLPELKRNPEVTRITYGGTGKYLEVGSVAVPSVYLTTAKGPMVLSLDGGHYPQGVGQIDLGETTLAQARLHVGSRVSVSVVNQKGVRHSGKFRVAGTVTLPPVLGIGGLGDGAVISIHALEVLACPRGPTQRACIGEVAQKIAADDDWAVAIGVKSGAAGRATVATLERKYAADVSVQTRPINLVNFGQAIDFPLLLEGTLVLFGVAALGHLLFVSVTRRRRQFALLKVLGFVRRQVRSAMCWQAATVAVIGVVVGVPLGLIIGQLVWRDFATSLGAVPVAVSPTVTILILAVATIGGAVLLALVPATLAARVRPAEALRES